MPPHLKESINQAHLENGTYKQIVSDLKRELELNGLEAPDELQINTLMQEATKQNSEKSESTCHLCKKPGHYQNQCRKLKRKKERARINQKNADNTATFNSGQTDFNSNKMFLTIPTQTLHLIKKTEDLDLSTNLVRPVVKLTIPLRNVTLEKTQRTDRLPETKDRKNKSKPNRELPKATQMAMFRLQPKLQTKNATCSLRSCVWQTGDNWNTKTSINSRGCLAAEPRDSYKSI